MTAPDRELACLSGIVEWRLGERRRYVWRPLAGGGALEFYREEPQAAPVNYGCLPGTWNPADAAEIDAVWLGGPREVGERPCLAPSGLLWLRDGDHKVIFGDLHGQADDPGQSGSVSSLLGWFPPARGARLLGAAEVRAWLRSVEQDQDAKGRGGP